MLYRIILLIPKAAAIAQVETERFAGVEPPGQHDGRVRAGALLDSVAVEVRAREILVERASLADLQGRDLDGHAGLFDRGRPPNPRRRPESR